MMRVPLPQLTLRAHRGPRRGTFSTTLIARIPGRPSPPPRTSRLGGEERTKYVPRLTRRTPPPAPSPDTETGPKRERLFNKHVHTHYDETARTRSRTRTYTLTIDALYARAKSGRAIHPVSQETTRPGRGSAKHSFTRQFRRLPPPVVRRSPLRFPARPSKPNSTDSSRRLRR